MRGEIRKHVVILGGGPAGHATAVAIPEALVIERAGLHNVGDNRTFGPHFLWRRLSGFEVKPTKVVSHIDGELATDVTVAAYRKKVGRVDDRRPWYDEYGPQGTQFQIEKWPEIRALWGVEVKKVHLADHVVQVKSGRLTIDIGYDCLINTLPMPNFWRMTSLFRDLDDVFSWSPIYVWQRPYEERDRKKRQELGLTQHDDRYINWISSPETAIFRESHHPSGVQYETLAHSLQLDDFREADTGNVKLVHTHWPGKIWANERELRVITKMARGFDVFFCGRYGRWDYAELLHHTYEHALEVRKGIGL